jgi:hypothetical protein
MSKLVVYPNFFGAQTAAEGSGRTGHENSVVKRWLVRDRANVKVRYENPTSSNLVLANPMFYYTTNDTATGTVAGSGLVNFGGTNSVTLSSGEIKDSDVLSGLPTVAGYNPTATTSGTRPVFFFTRTNASAAETITATWISPYDGELWESASSNVALTDRHTTPTEVPVTDAVRQVYGPSLVYGDESDGDVALLNMGDSNTAGFTDELRHWGPNNYLGENLNLPFVVYAANGSSFNGGYLSNRAASPNTFLGLEMLTSHIMYFYDINAYRDMTTAQQGVDLWDSSAAGLANIIAANAATGNTDMKVVVCTYPPEIGVSSGSQAARKAGNQAKRDDFSNGTYSWIVGCFDYARMLEASDNEDAYRTDLGPADRLCDNLHFGTRGMLVLCRAADASVFSITGRVTPLLHPPYVVKPGGWIESNVVCYNADEVEPQKLFRGVTFAATNGTAVGVGGHIMPPTTGSRRYVATARMYLTRGLESTESITSVGLSGSFNMTGADGRKGTLVDLVVGETLDQVNNSTHTAPTAVGASSGLIDRDFSSATHDDDLAIYYQFNGTGAISGSVGYQLVNPNSAVWTGANFSLTPSLGPRARIIVESRNWVTSGSANIGGLIVAWGMSTSNNPPGYNEHLNVRISDSGGGNYVITPYSYDFSTSNIALPGFVPANNNRVTITVLPTGGVIDRILISVYDVTSSTARLTNHLFEWTNSQHSGIGGGNRPIMTGSWRVGLTNGGDAGSYARATRFAVDRLVDDTTAPDPSGPFVDESGYHVVIPYTESSVPMLPASPTPVTGFSGDGGKTITNSFMFGDNYTLLTLHDDSRFFDGDAAGSFDFVNGSSALTPRDAFGTYLATFNNLSVTNNSEAAGSQAVAPVISPSGGTVSSGQRVTLTSTTTGSSIYYSVNGVDPTNANALYNSASKPTLSSTGTIDFRAITYADGYTASTVSRAIFVVSTGNAGETGIGNQTILDDDELAAITSHGIKRLALKLLYGTSPTLSARTDPDRQLADEEEISYVRRESLRRILRRLVNRRFRL